MASAWGSSWGSAWGDAWGAIAAAAAATTGAGPGGWYSPTPVRKDWRDKNRDEIRALVEKALKVAEATPETREEAKEIREEFAIAAKPSKAKPRIDWNALLRDLAAVERVLELYERAQEEDEDEMLMML